MPGAVDLLAFVGQRQARDGAAPWLESRAVIGSAAHRRVQAETLLVGTQRLGERGVARQGSPHREHRLLGTQAECDASGRARTQDLTDPET